MSAAGLSMWFWSSSTYRTLISVGAVGSLPFQSPVVLQPSGYVSWPVGLYNKITWLRSFWICLPEGGPSGSAPPIKTTAAGSSASRAADVPASCSTRNRNPAQAKTAARISMTGRTPWIPRRNSIWITVCLKLHITFIYYIRFYFCSPLELCSNKYIALRILLLALRRITITETPAIWKACK